MLVSKRLCTLFLVALAIACTDPEPPPTGKLGVAALLPAESDTLAVVDVETGAILYELPGSFCAASISPDGTTAAAIGADRWPVRVDLATGHAQVLETKARQHSIWQWGHVSNWFTIPLEFTTSLIAEDASKGRNIGGYPLLESKSTGTLAYSLPSSDGSILVMENPDGSERVEKQISHFVGPLAFIGESILTEEYVSEQPVLRERSREGEFLRELGITARPSTGERALSPGGKTLLMTNYLGLYELDLDSGERVEILGPHWGVSGQYIDDDTFLVGIIRNLDPAQDDTPEEAGSLEIVSRDGTRRELYRDKELCGGSGLLSPNLRYVAVQCYLQTEVYEIASGQQLASVPSRRLLGFSGDSEAVILVTWDEDGAWLGVQPTAPGRAVRRVAKLSDNADHYQDVGYAMAAPWLSE